MHLADAFIQSDLHFFYQYVVIIIVYLYIKKMLADDNELANYTWC